MGLIAARNLSRFEGVDVPLQLRRGSSRDSDPLSIGDQKHSNLLPPLAYFISKDLQRMATSSISFMWRKE
ncbi:unnamed protein product [Linum trigynum]|uniref:Uncharacterized protein n=1 Tax=Linum trigynum TaxID=586398 RepID=A0AAV2GKU8_9ROSI